MADLTVAVVGATGAVGAELLRVLEERRFPLGELRAFASPGSAGRALRFRGRALAVEPLAPERLAGVDLAFFSAGAALAREWAPRAVEAGALVVDNSSAFRADPAVPLVVPEVDPRVEAGARLLANPNCTTTLLCLALAPLERAAGLVRVVVATYQAASGAGARALAELEEQAADALAGREPRVLHLPRALAFNLIPQVGPFLPDGSSQEEDKVLRETRRILRLPDLRLSATCVRVPVRRAHSLAVWVELARPLSPVAARELLAAAPGLRLEDDPAAGRYPTPREAEGRDEVLVGRVRTDPGAPGERGLALFLSGDQLRKGAALNAVQVAELTLGLRGAGA